MATFSPEELAKIAAERDHLEWFTVVLSGKLHRYVVWLTHIPIRNFKLIAKYAELFHDLYVHSLTFWKRTNPSNKKEVCYDIWTSSDDLEEALSTGRLYGQQTVYDTLTGIELPVVNSPR